MNRTTIAALLIAALAAGAAAPAFAAEHGPWTGNHREFHFRGPGAPHGPWMQRHGRDGMRMAARGGRQFLRFVCSERGADRLEHMLLTIAQRTDPTSEQQPLYDTFKAAALTAQADFAKACADARPARGQAGARDLADRLEARLDIEKARVAAMTQVLPAFEAFYDSLSDEQRSTFGPRHLHHRRMLDEPRREQRPANGIDPSHT